MYQQKQGQPHPRLVCIYCGNTADTEDHIPSKNLFLTKHRQKVKFSKVPACRVCNVGFSKDEEFLRNFFTTLGNEESDRAAELFNTKVKSSIEQRPALGRSILRNMTLVDIFTPAGIYIGKRTKIQITQVVLDRIFAVMNKYVSGLSYVHLGSVLPKNFIIRHAWTDIENPVFKEQKLIGNILWNTSNSPTFIYGFAKIPETSQTVWIIEFFQKILFLSFAFPDSSQMAKIATENLYSVKPKIH